MLPGKHYLLKVHTEHKLPQEVSPAEDLLPEAAEKVPPAEKKYLSVICVIILLFYTFSRIFILVLKGALSNLGKTTTFLT